MGKKFSEVSPSFSWFHNFPHFPSSKSTWPILFSKFYEALQISGPELPKKNVIIAINWTGIYMIDDQEQFLAEFTFADIFFITFEQSNNLHKVMFTTVSNLLYKVSRNIQKSPFTYRVVQLRHKNTPVSANNPCRFDWITVYMAIFSNKKSKFIWGL